MGLFIRYIRGSAQGKGIGSAGDVLSSHSPKHGAQWAGLLAATADSNPDGGKEEFSKQKA